MKIRLQRLSGLSLVEVVLVIATVALLVLVLLPAFHRTTSRSSRISCTYCLKQIAIAYRSYSPDHYDQFPFAVSSRFGGTLEFANSPQVFRHFAVMSNELGSPKILVCPIDSRSGKKRSATDFLGPLSNDNVSYFVGLNAQESKPSTILSGDRNIEGATASNGFLRWFKPDAPAGWTSDIHKNAGNIGLADGSVLQTTNLSLRRAMQSNTLAIIRLAIP